MLIEILQQRDGLLTTVRLKVGTQHVVRDIAWGYDFGDEYAHITPTSARVATGSRSTSSTPTR